MFMMQPHTIIIMFMMNIIGIVMTSRGMGVSRILIPIITPRCGTRIPTFPIFIIAISISMIGQESGLSSVA